MIDRLRGWWKARTSRPREDRAERRTRRVLQLSEMAEKRYSAAMNELADSFRATDTWIRRR